MTETIEVKECVGDVLLKNIEACKSLLAEISSADHAKKTELSKELFDLLSIAKKACKVTVSAKNFSLKKQRKERADKGLKMSPTHKIGEETYAGKGAFSKAFKEAIEKVCGKKFSECSKQERFDAIEQYRLIK